MSLGLLNDVYLQHVRIIQSTHAMRFYTEEGSMRPVVTSSLGWLLLSTRTPEQIERLVRRANIAIADPSQRVDVAAMVKRILSLKGQTQIHIEGMPFADGATMCALLPVTIHGQPVVLGLGGSLERVRENRVRYAEVLRGAVGAV
ncbi:hypothetical protein F9K07_06225 [Hydrogenophaga sp. BPS33]|nr:hypothetical protein [Hydrogenophaga sp. BPS33]QHE84511.1 hypothetical protein F9K07_06225 [Hydrogenophaga sp. BPS33]